MKFRDFMNNNQLIDLKDGYDVTYRPSLYAIIENNESVLLVKDGRSNMWEIPGGGLDIGESIQEGLFREIKEETGYEIDSDIELIHVLTENYYHGQRDKFFCGVCIYYSVKLLHEKQGEQNLDSPDEIVDMKWVKIDEINVDELNSYQQEAMRLYLNKNE